MLRERFLLKPPPHLGIPIEENRIFFEARVEMHLLADYIVHDYLIRGNDYLSSTRRKLGPLIASKLRFSKQRKILMFHYPPWIRSKFGHIEYI